MWQLEVDDPQQPAEGYSRMINRRQFVAFIAALPVVGKLAIDRVKTSSSGPSRLVFADGSVVYTSQTTIDSAGRLTEAIEAKCDDAILYCHKTEIDRFFAARKGMKRLRQSWCSDVLTRRTRFTLVDQEIRVG